MNIDEASKAIAKILATLESETGCNVESISLTRVEVTTYMDKNIQHVVRVNIELVRQPGHKWDV